MIISYSLRDETAKRFALEIASQMPILKIYLFGSTARRDDHIESDIDIAIIGERQIYLSEKNKLNDLVTNYLLDHELLINWFYIDKKDWDLKIKPIVKNIQKEGILLWEKETI